MANSAKNTTTTIGKDMHLEITKRCASLTVESGHRVKVKDWVETHLAKALEDEGVHLPNDLRQRLELGLKLKQPI